MSSETLSGLLKTKQPDLWFEDNAIGRLKKEVWEASDAQIDAWLKEYGMPTSKTKMAGTFARPFLYRVLWRSP